MSSSKELGVLGAAQSEEEEERDDPPLVNSLCGGASGPEPFSEGRPVKSILPHIVKGQHRGTRL